MVLAITDTCVFKARIIFNTAATTSIKTTFLFINEYHNKGGKATDEDILISETSG